MTDHGQIINSTSQPYAPPIQEEGVGIPGPVEIMCLVHMHDCLLIQLLMHFVEVSSLKFRRNLSDAGLALAVVYQWKGSQNNVILTSTSGTFAIELTNLAQEVSE